MDSSRSTTNYLLNVYGGTISWKSELINSVALSTKGAEIMASSVANQKRILYMSMLSEIGIFPQAPTTSTCAAIAKAIAFTKAYVIVFEPNI